MRAYLSALTLIPVLAACAANEMPTAREGEVLYAENCAACHGSAAEGGVLVNGQTASELTGLAAANDGVFPRAQVLSRIDGYGQRHDQDDVMPEFGTLLTGELVPVDVDGTLTPTPRPLAALMTYLESVQLR